MPKKKTNKRPEPPKKSWLAEALGEEPEVEEWHHFEYTDKRGTKREKLLRTMMSQVAEQWARYMNDPEVFQAQERAREVQVSKEEAKLSAQREREMSDEPQIALEIWDDVKRYFDNAMYHLGAAMHAEDDLRGLTVLLRARDNCRELDRHIDMAVNRLHNRLEHRGVIRWEKKR